MQLKLLIVPSLAIFSLIMGIGFIKPDYSSLTEKKAALEMKRTEAANIQKIESNLQSLSQSLESNSEIVTFTNNYYPAKLDQERAVDAMNFLASQSGVILTGIELQEVVDETTQAESLPNVPMTSLQASDFEGGDPALVPAAPPYTPPLPKAYVLKVKAQGPYENLRNFIDRVSHFDRMSEINRFAIERREKEEEQPQEGQNQDQQNQQEEQNQEPVPSGELEAQIEARLSYLPGQTGINALSVPVFEKSDFDFGPAEAAREWATNVVPPLSPGETGKSNPFQ